MTSYWIQDAPYQDYQSAPALPARTHAVVIGGGLTGVSAAYWLRRLGVEVVALERRGLSGGATGRNGGHLIPGPAELFSDAIARYGAETARDLYTFTRATVRAVAACIAEHNIPCDLARHGAVSLALSEAELPRLRAAAEALARHGLPGEYWDAGACAERTHSASFLGGLFLPEGQQVWPARFVFGLAEQALRLGAQLFTQTEVTAVERAGPSLLVRTSRGPIRADAVLHATNAWARELLPALRDVIVPVRGQVIATAPAPPLWPFGLVANFGYEYWRQLPDSRIVLGGQRWRSPTQESNCADDGVLHPAVSAGLREFLPRHFPALRNVPVEREWTGIMGFTPDLNPLVGSAPGRPGEYVAAGYSGHGMPVAFLAAKAVAEMMTGRAPETFVEAFRPERWLNE